MCTIECLKSPTVEQIQPIIGGVVAYGEQQVKGNASEKYVFHLKENKELIGGIVGALQYERFYLSHVWVSEKYRNNGYASRLLKYCEVEMKQLGCSSIILETLNEKAVELYLKHNYMQVGRIPKYVKGFDLVHMVKKI